MTLQSLLAGGQLRRHRTSPKEIAELLQVVDRDLADAGVEAVSPDRRFATGYNAALALSSIEDIMRLRRPMTLDVAHLHDAAVMWRVLKEYHPHIRTVHLSGKRGGRPHHLPIDEECLQVVEALLSYDWQGNVILEYLPEYHQRLEEDLRSLSRRFRGPGAWKEPSRRWRGGRRRGTIGNEDRTVCRRSPVRPAGIPWGAEA